MEQFTLGLNGQECPEVSGVVDQFDASGNNEELWSLETDECVRWLFSIDTSLFPCQPEETKTSDQQLDSVLPPPLCELGDCVSITTLESEGSYHHWLSSLENNSELDQQVADDDAWSLAEFIAAEQFAVRLNTSYTRHCFLPALKPVIIRTYCQRFLKKITYHTNGGL